MTWRDDAACTGLPKELFYPPYFKEDRTGPEHRYYSLGKLACEVCPVRSRCARDGEDEEFGLWGGLTPRERAGKSAPRRPAKVLPRRLLRLLRSMSADPIEVMDLHERIKPFLEKRNKEVDSSPQSS